MGPCAVIKKTGKNCGDMTDNMVSGFHVCDRHDLQYHKGKTLKVKVGKNVAKLRNNQRVEETDAFED